MCLVPNYNPTCLIDSQGSQLTYIKAESFNFISYSCWIKKSFQEYCHPSIKIQSYEVGSSIISILYRIWAYDGHSKPYSREGCTRDNY